MKYFTIALSLILSSILCAQAEKIWAWENPVPQGNAIGGMWGTARNDIFAVGSAGTIIHFDGNRWQEMVSGTDAGISKVHGSASDNVIAVCQSNNTILHFDGNTWKKMPSPPQGTLLVVQWRTTV